MSVSTETDAVATSAQDATALIHGSARDLVEWRRRPSPSRRRGWLIRRLLLLADLGALSLAFLLAAAIAGLRGAPNNVEAVDFLAFFLSLPVWVVLANVHGLYDRDAELTDHSLVDDFIGVFQLITAGVWLLLLGAWAIGLPYSNRELATFWLLALVLVTAARATARLCWQKSDAYIQNTVIVGAEAVGQLVARKILKHPEYGFNLVGFVDRDARELRSEIAHLPFLGRLDELSGLVRQFQIERIVVAFTGDRHDTLKLIRSLNNVDVQIDVVPRLFEVFTPTVSVHTIESFPVVSLPPPRLPPSARLLKRTLDIVGASIGLALTAPFFAFAAWRIRRDSPGPVFFRQTRVGQDMRKFCVLKFRTMHVDTDAAEHRQYIGATMDASAAPEASGVYKLDRSRAVTRTGRWLRETSLDELPQLLNVLRGEMSLVGPRPCLPYETEHFQDHHFERFQVPPGITGLWQVSARGNSTFGEALDMDVAYARGWSLGLDLRLLLRTPVAVLRQRRATA